MDSTSTTTAQSVFCSACGARLTEGARFCHRCGAEVGAPVAAPGAGGALPWSVAAIALVALVSLLAGQYFGKRMPMPAAATADATPAGRAPDISAMSPQERADRLFDRVMAYVGTGKMDSAVVFAPMAMAALEAVTPRTAHTRYDLGLVAAATGDATSANAQVDTILRERPNHLLGLVLAIRIAEAKGDTTARAALEKRLLGAESTERATGLKEYVEHDNDIRTAVTTARNRPVR